MEDMDQDYGWSMDDFWEEEPLTPEEQARADRAEAEALHLEMLGEVYWSQFAFD